jgi:hypothetical protein
MAEHLKKEIANRRTTLTKLKSETVKTGNDIKTWRKNESALKAKLAGLTGDALKTATANYDKAVKVRKGLEDTLEIKNKEFAEANKLDAEQRVTALNSDIPKMKAANDKLKLDILVAKSAVASVGEKLKDTTLTKELKKSTEEEKKTLETTLENLKADQKIGETLYK